MRFPDTQRAARCNQNGFSMIEAMIAFSIVGVAVAAMMMFTEMTTRSLASVNQQTLSNQKAGQFASFVTQRVRAANFMTNNSGETEILLAFDDDTSSDSDKDGNLYNDRDHYELFSFSDEDQKPDTYTDNRILYRPDTSNKVEIVLASGGVKFLPGTNLFVMSDHPPGTTNGYRTLHVNLGFYHAEGGNRTQTIEIKTSAFRRN